MSQLLPPGDGPASLAWWLEQGAGPSRALAGSVLSGPPGLPSVWASPPGASSTAKLVTAGQSGRRDPGHGALPGPLSWRSAPADRRPGRSLSQGGA